MSFSLPSVDALQQPELARRLQHKLDNLTKPLGWLGRIFTGKV